ncbi:tRNA-guanine transglycosylase DpdA [Sandaracinobacteroides hominis]|uniref:tRNA-guanine transglycosylase DpdA n=1 Tax=Sandaracinobacteroides hominis TaxID=2780086 RepID=UPI0018F316E2|nr:tRNA-guanine transglycosylase DpdA [Sandaracinobacteroides hominis]
MKFIFADSLDYVDPAFDFIGDRSPAERQPYWDDAYPHEILGYAPYDGVLVSRGIVGDHRVKGKYTASQARRFHLVGVRKFLRLDKPEFAHLDIFGDCGAFTYVQEERPPYSAGEMAEFYDECGFTHGCSVDHIIFDFNPAGQGMSGGTDDAKARFEITLENADAFRREAKAIDASFTPLGVVQGWSPGSMAEAARRLVTMGYDYLAIGGMVPLKSPEIKLVLEAIREAVPASTRLHILGFAKADDIDSFHGYDIASFDTTSPLLRAFKDAKQNYYLPGEGLGLRYFTSIRVPQAIENPKLQRGVKKGMFRAEELVRLEALALNSLRAFDRGAADLEETLHNVLVYSAPLVEEKPYEDCKDSVALTRLGQS